MTQHIEEEARRVGGTPETMVGEGRADVPVGTTLAMIDMAQKVLAAVHKNLHSAQAEELHLLRNLFIQHPEALICPTSRPWRMDDLVRTLSNCNLTPQSDPNTASHGVRVMKAVALVQLVQMAPQNFDMAEVAKRVSTMVGLGSLEELLTEPQQQGDPANDAKLAAAQIDAQVKMQQIAADIQEAANKGKMEVIQAQIKLLIEKMRLQNDAAQRQSSEMIARDKETTQRLSLAQTALVHPQSIPMVQQWSPLPGMNVTSRVI
jgi:hypothetical protein